MKLGFFFLVVLVQSCAFLPKGPVGAYISDGQTFEGATYKYRVVLLSKQASHSHNFTQFLFSTPHEDAVTILTNSITGIVDANSLLVISAHDKTRLQVWNDGHINFKGNQVIVDLRYSNSSESKIYDCLCNGKYEVGS